MQDEKQGGRGGPSADGASGLQGLAFKKYMSRVCSKQRNNDTPGRRIEAQASVGATLRPTVLVGFRDLRSRSTCRVLSLTVVWSRPSVSSKQKKGPEPWEFPESAQIKELGRAVRSTARLEPQKPGFNLSLACSSRGATMAVVIAMATCARHAQP